MITKIFMVQGTVIGVIGTIAGTMLGVTLALTISDIISWFNTALGLNLFDAYFVHYLPSYLRWQDVVVIVTVSLLLSFLATIYLHCVQPKFNQPRRCVMSKIVLEAKDIYKHFDDGKTKVEVIKRLVTASEQGEFVSIVGSSGSGKKYTAACVGGFGTTLIAGTRYFTRTTFDNLGEAERGYKRNQYLGFVYQFHHLLPEFSALKM